MSADLHIHIIEEPLTIAQVKEFLSGIMGTKYFSFASLASDRTRSAAWRNATGSPNVWVGEVSWLKAMIFEGGEETFIPGPVQCVADVIGEDFPEITSGLINTVYECISTPNKTDYDVSSAERIGKFLVHHVGKKVFCISH